MTRLSCFKAYDIRGRVPDELDTRLAAKIGLAAAKVLGLKKTVIGRDARLSGPEIAAALADGLAAGGSRVFDLGLCGTEEIYFAAADLDVDAGIMVTASHNPADYNGMKIVLKDAVPVGRENGLAGIEEMAAGMEEVETKDDPGPEPKDIRGRYISHILSLVDASALPPLKVVVNPGNGCAGVVLEELEEKLPFELVRINFEPDGGFPNGVPNPLLPENREATSRAVREHGADIGVAWDGDFDRCFLFDEQGSFIEGYYIVGLLAAAILKKNPGARIIHDPRLIWNTREIVEKAGGVPVMSRTGHVFIKERMRQENAVYGGEMSAHHYFRDFFYCDSGMIPWLLVCELMGKEKRPLSALVNAMREKYPVSGEINRRVKNPDLAIARVEAHFAEIPAKRDFTDGISIETADYRLNLRKSNTEPLIRLNVETRGNRELLEKVTEEVLGLIGG